MLPAAQRGQRSVAKPLREVVDSTFQMLWSALEPLKRGRELAFQFPPYFVAQLRNFEYLASLPERLPEASIAIEFRHPSWVLEKAKRAVTMKFLRAHALASFSRCRNLPHQNPRAKSDHARRQPFPPTEIVDARQAGAILVAPDSKLIEVRAVLSDSTPSTE
ncbi:MAG: DUF72 domain-containing protein [Candidatus Binataceae bacterium]